MLTSHLWCRQQLLSANSIARSLLKRQKAGTVHCQQDVVLLSEMTPRYTSNQARRSWLLSLFRLLPSLRLQHLPQRRPPRLAMVATHTPATPQHLTGAATAAMRRRKRVATIPATVQPRKLPPQHSTRLNTARRGHSRIHSLHGTIINLRLLLQLPAQPHLDARPPRRQPPPHPPTIRLITPLRARSSSHSAQSQIPSCRRHRARRISRVDGRTGRRRRTSRPRCLRTCVPRRVRREPRLRPRGQSGIKPTMLRTTRHPRLLRVDFPLASSSCPLL